MDYVECGICGKRFRAITNTHLKKSHFISVEEYRSRFPYLKLKSELTCYLIGQSNRNLSYEERYGKERGEELRQSRHKSAVNQMKDYRQRECRRETARNKKWTLFSKNSISYKKRERDGTLNSHRDYRQRAIEYYGTTCNICKRELKNNRYLHVHHIDHKNFPNRYGNHSIENLMVLCTSCHLQLHNSYGQNGKAGSLVSQEIKKLHELIGVFELNGILVDFYEFKEYINKYLKEKHNYDI